jgi:hypothetical protein
MQENHVDVCMRAFTHPLFALDNFPYALAINTWIDRRKWRGASQSVKHCIGWCDGAGVGGTVNEVSLVLFPQRFFTIVSNSLSKH